MYPLTECGGRAHEVDAGKVIREAVVFHNRDVVLNAFNMLPVLAIDALIGSDVPLIIRSPEGTIPDGNKEQGECNANDATD